MKEKDSLKSIIGEVKNCELCRLYLSRRKTVPGEGNPKSDLLFIGEGPGKNEDLEGRPFVGPAGKFLEEMLKSINLTRQDVFIANVIKCRPPMNRDPEEDEIKICRDYLFRQIKIIKPKLIATLGRFSLRLFIPEGSISSIHGRLKRISFRDPKHSLYDLGPIYLLPLYHPAAALYRGSMREVEMADFKNIIKILRMLEGKIKV